MFGCDSGGHFHNKLSNCSVSPASGQSFPFIHRSANDSNRLFSGHSRKSPKYRRIASIWDRWARSAAAFTSHNGLTSMLKTGRTPFAVSVSEQTTNSCWTDAHLPPVTAFVTAAETAI